MQPVTKITIFGFRLAVVALAAFWLLIFVGTHLPPAMVASAPRVNDKVQHFAAFFFLGTLMCYVTTSPRWFRRFTTIGLAGMAYGAIDEITQGFVPGRDPSLFDFLADSAGVWAAIGLYVIARYRFKNVVDARLAART